jgi:hypothetical protein
MIRAYRLYTGPDGSSHVTPCTVNADKVLTGRKVKLVEF